VTPQGVHADSGGNVYFSDTGNDCVKRKDAETGAVTVVAGICGSRGFSGDGGPATSAQLDTPCGIYLDENQNLYIADSGNGRVRKVNAATQNITTVMDGMSSPEGVDVDASGNIYASDRPMTCVKRKDAQTGDVTVFAGICGSSGYSGDGGPATSAEFYNQIGIGLKETASNAQLEKITGLYK
jgi:DNA-binding beta-propeller fold protein YncE